MKMYNLISDGETLIMAETLDDAYFKFMIDIKEGRYPRDKLGLYFTIIDSDDGQKHHFKTEKILALVEARVLKEGV